MGLHVLCLLAFMMVHIQLLSILGPPLTIPSILLAKAMPGGPSANLVGSYKIALHLLQAVLSIYALDIVQAYDD